MGWFSRTKKSSTPVRAAPTVPSDQELLDRLRDIEDVNRQIDQNAELQALMRQMLGQPPADTPPADVESTRKNITRGGLSYIASPPADFPDVAPEAHELWLGKAFMASMMGNDAQCLAIFTDVLEITRRIGHRTGEARVLYNIGVAHYKLGQLDQAITVLLEGRAVTEGSARELAREARKVQRFEEEAKADEPRVDVIGVPHSEQRLLEMYLEALATVYEADAQPEKASACRDELKRLTLQAT